MKTCKTCQYWNRDYNIVNGVSDCCLIDHVAPKGRTDLAVIQLTADDDGNLNAVFLTGKDFGCIHHTEKE